MLELDNQSLFNVAVSMLGGLGGWVLKTVWDSVRDLQKSDIKLTEKVNEIEVLVAGNYVRKGDMDKLTDALFRKLDKIEDALNRKADK